jgi:hypothetical protein
MRQRFLWRASVMAWMLGCGSSDSSGPPDGDGGTVDSTTAADGPRAADSAVAESAADRAVRDSAANETAGDGFVDSTVPVDATGPSGDSAGGDAAPGEAGAPPCDPHCGDVVTWHNDNLRSGQNLYESTLTPSNVNSTQFGKLFTLSVDGKVDAQPLVVSAVNVAGKGLHDVVFVATEHDSLYAFDARSNAGASATPLWQVSLLGAGETTSDQRGCGQVIPEIGTTATPVIDLATGTLYAVAMSKMGTQYFQRLHAIDITSGAERQGSPVAVQANAPGTGPNSDAGTIVFEPKQYKERAALLLASGVLYLTWASHCDILPYNGWVMSYDAATLNQKQVLNITPNGVEGANWGSGAGPAADTNGNIYFLAANGTFDTTLDSNGFPSKKDFGNGMLRISTTGALAVADYFEAFDTASQSATDTDFGSGGAMLLPDEVGSTAHPHLIVGAGKDGNIYLVDREDMGKWNAMNNAQIVQEVVGGVAGAGGIFSSPAYFDHAIYYGDVARPLKRFAIDGAQIATPATSTSALSFVNPGTTPSISANGAASNPASTAIVWAAENAAQAVLHAYSATNLATELYSSAQADGGRDSFGDGNKFIVPTVANGRVYVGTQTGVGVFGLLP